MWRKWSLKKPYFHCRMPDYRITRDKYLYSALRLEWQIWSQNIAHFADCFFMK